jgi:hypothetical protein
MAVYCLLSKKTKVSFSYVPLSLHLTRSSFKASDDYAGFLFDDTGNPLEPSEFCRQYVDPLGKEAGHYTEL